MKTLMLCSDMRSENWTVIQKSVQMFFEEDSECHRASRHPRIMITLTSRSCDPGLAAAISGAINTPGQGLLCFIDYIFCWTSFGLPPHRREAWGVSGVMWCVTFITTWSWVTRVTSALSLSDKLWHCPAWQQIPGPGAVTLREAERKCCWSGRRPDH